jgi:hypothetical protein
VHKIPAAFNNFIHLTVLELLAIIYTMYSNWIKLSGLWTTIDDLFINENPIRIHNSINVKSDGFLAFSSTVAPQTISGLNVTKFHPEMMKNIR